MKKKKIFVLPCPHFDLVTVRCVQEGNEMPGSKSLDRARVAEGSRISPILPLLPLPPPLVGSFVASGNAVATHLVPVTSL